MLNPKRAALRLALTGCLTLAGLTTLAAQGRAAAPPEKVFPDTAIFFLKVNNAAGLREAFRQSQYGQLWADPAMKDFREDLKARVGEATKSLKQQVGLTLPELLELPQGPAALAVLPKDDAEQAAAVVLTTDAGKNADTLAGVLARATKIGEDQGGKVSKETFKGLIVQTIVLPRPKDLKEGQSPPPPLSWTRDGTVFTIGTDLDSVKDTVANASGRDNALAGAENFAAAARKLGSDAQGLWYADVAKVITLVTKIQSRGKNAANVEQIKAMSQVLGINGLKAAAGTLNLNTGPYDSLTKTFVLAPAPLQGVLKLFSLPRVDLRPEPWVPATVASYQTWSWDLDVAFVALNDLANMFQPGVLNVLEQQLVGPNGGEPLNFKKDLFDPLGDRISVISDFKKPITEDSQRMLIGVALEDPKGFQTTLGKLINLAGGKPETRDFQGVKVYDFQMPDLPNARAQNVQLKGKISLAISRNTLFISSEPTLLEQAIRGGGPTLADSSQFQSVAKEMPEKVSALTYVRPDESARLSYDMIKSGQFEKALQGAAVGGGADVSKIGKFFDKDKLPEFSVFAKYLSNGGGFTVMDDDGVSITNFTLRKANP
jgi:hypothetical protein